MNHKHFRFDCPGVVSFSGGRTSGYMLWRTLQAHGGVLPDDVKVLFANTGKERPETLDFVERCSQEWGVSVVWLEYRRDAEAPLLSSRKVAGFPTIGCHSFAVVDYATASRKGEPFETLLGVLADYRREAKGEGPMLPSRSGGRPCTAELKVRTMRRWLESIVVDPGDCLDAIGIRADEPKRVAKIRRQTASEWEIGEPVLPLVDAGVTEADVMEFWSRQPFDLKLSQYQENCDLCFLKSRRKLLRIMRESPELADWWISQEVWTDRRWSNEFGAGGYAAAVKAATEPTLLAVLDSDGDEIACHCTD